MWSRTAALPDSQAGSAYFWTVQPCKTETVCTPLAHATHAFNKMSNQVELLAPADGATVQDDVSLSWEDFLATQASADTSDTVLTTPARTEALSYRVQTATDPNFQSIIETTVVDQTTFTSYATTYPEGPVYWRVQAIDGSRQPAGVERGPLVREAVADAGRDEPGAAAPDQRQRAVHLGSARLRHVVRRGDLQEQRPDRQRRATGS